MAAWGVLALALVAQVPTVATSTLGVRTHLDDPVPPVDGITAPEPPPAEADAERSLLWAPELSLLASIGTELDTNAPRVPTSTSAPPPPGDGVVRVLADLRARLFVTQRDVITIRYVLGMKRFYSEVTEDLVVHDLDGSASIGLFDGVDLSVRGRYRASRIRSEARDYTLGSLGGGLSWRPQDWLRVSAEARYDILDFPPACVLSYQGPALRGGVDLTPLEAVEVGVFGGWSWRRYRGSYTGAAITSCSQAFDPRQDQEPYAGIHGTFRGPFLAGLELTGRFSNSNEANEDIDRFRALAWASVPLVWEVVLNVQGALQFNRGTSASGSLRPEDDENQNSLEIQLARPLFGGLDGVLRYAVYANEFATATADFSRHTFYVGLSYETGTR